MLHRNLTFPVLWLALCVLALPNRVRSTELDTPLSGNWLETVCNEGDYGPDLPPPPYIKGVIRFGDHLMRWSSRIYDDKDCTALRPGAIAETIVPYTIAPSDSTTDGSIAIDLLLPEVDPARTVPMFGLVKVDDGKLYVGLFPTLADRPKRLELRQAQSFAPLSFNYKALYLNPHLILAPGKL